MDICIADRGVHHFEPRYDYEEPKSESIVALIESKCGLKTAIKTIEGLKGKVYVKDVCINCGAEIKK